MRRKYEFVLYQHVSRVASDRNDSFGEDVSASSVS